MDEESSKCIDPLGKNMNLINLRSYDAVAYTSFIPLTI
ncbi:hypothetical protein J2Z25_002574 [Clostridium tertium]|nr:hypothetical protein [Clostridium tertium]